MKKFASAVALLMVFVLVFTGCNRGKKPADQTTGGEGGSDIVSQSSTELSTQKGTHPLSGEKLIALTFDDGPRATTTNRVLDVLEKNGSTATFFIVGYNIDKNVETIKRACEMGCEIANHSKDHKNLTKLTYSEIWEQVDSPNKKVKTLAGIEPRLFRAPGGNYDGVEADIGMPIIQWSVDTEDWKYKDAAKPDRTPEQRDADLKEIADRVVNNAEKGDIVLMHDIYDFTADLCELIVPGLIEKGFKLVTVSEMYEAYGKELKGGVVYDCIKFNPAEDNTRVVEAGSYKVKTKGGALNIRTEPDFDAQSVLKLANGTEVTVTKSVAGWAYVTYGDSQGWVNSAYLEEIQ